MTQSEKSIFLSVFLIVAISVAVLLLMHPKVKSLLLADKLTAESDQINTAQRQWQINDQYYFGYRNPSSHTVPEGPWLEDYPSLRGLNFLQVSILQSKRNYSVDLVTDDLILAQQLAATLTTNTSDSHSLALVKIYTPEEAAAANGYYFEDRNLRQKYWVNISHYSL